MQLLGINSDEMLFLETEYDFQLELIYMLLSHVRVVSQRVETSGRSAEEPTLSCHCFAK